MVTILVSLDSIDPAAIEALLDRAFGANRHQRAAHRLRGGTAPIDALSFAACRPDGTLAGVIQCWPVALACDAGHEVPMVMIGPVAVEPALQHGGIGRRLMHHTLAAADRGGTPGADALMLIGDPQYYGRFFGFDAARTGDWRLDGPFEPHRLLARGRAVPDCRGRIIPRTPAPQPDNAA